MRLLITNPWNGQAYCILRSLRPRAARVVATRYLEHGVLGRLAPAAVSRLTDAVYPVPLAVADWQRGRLSDDNSPVEERFVQAVLEICRREAIDTVFPSWDPEVAILARNKARFTERGLILPVPEWPVLRRLMDKFAVAEAARAHGVPAPATYLPRDRADAREVASAAGFPLLLKPRFSSGARGVRLVTDLADLDRALDAVEPSFGMPILQEWIPGGLDGRVNVHVTLDRRLRRVAMSGRRNVRTVFPSFASVTTACVGFSDPALADRLTAMLRALGYVGHARAQLKLDPRDGLAKLLEINCRLGYRLWCEVAAGVDVPWLSIQVERGEPLPEDALGREDLVYLNPVEDALALAVAAWRAARRRLAPDSGVGLLGPPPPLRAVLARYRETYRAPHTAYDWYFRALRDDPLAALAWYATHLLRIARLPKTAPRAPAAPSAQVERLAPAPWAGWP